MRINQYLATANYCSRREADRLISAGKVKINDRKAILGDQVTEADHVFVNGKLIQIRTDKTYLAFNKPVGVIVTTDRSAKDNILDSINYPKRIFPVGRLDVASSGLIIMTDDNSIVEPILRSKKIDKQYEVVVDRDITDDFLRHLKQGVVIDGYKTLPAKVNKISNRQFEIIIVEGKNRQIRRMCEKFGYRVTKLNRVRLGNILLGNLKPGKYTHIPPQTIHNLLAHYNFQKKVNNWSDHCK